MVPKIIKTTMQPDAELLLRNRQINSRKRTRNAMVAFCTLTFVEVRGE